jgi:hypothetical protein
MDNVCHTHYANHSEKTYPEFINSFKKMILPWEPQEEDDKEEKEEAEEEEEVEPSSNLHLIWDDTELDDIDDDIMEEVCMGNNYNIKSKGAHKINHFLSTLKTATTSIERSLERTKDTRRNPTTTQPTTSMDLTQKILGDLKLDYDVVEDLKKMKVNITMFELCKITQLREKL